MSEPNPGECTVWINVYPGPGFDICNTKETADKNAGLERLDCIEVTLKWDKNKRLGRKKDEDI